MGHALIDTTRQNVVVEVTASPFPVAPQLVWEAVPAGDPDPEPYHSVWNGTTFEPLPGPAVSANDVRAELRRRIDLGGDGPDREIMANWVSRKTAEHAGKSPNQWPADDKRRYRKIEARWDEIERLESCAKALLARPSIPRDYHADRHWT